MDQVVPVLQELGVYRNGYTGTTLRDNRGLTIPTRAQEDRLAARTA